MSVFSLRSILDHAAEHDYGVPAFNVNNMEQIQAIMFAAHSTDSPVIIQVSRGARKYAQENYLRHLLIAAIELYPHIPVVIHQDHGNSPVTCFSAITQGFSSVMMDGSLLEDASTPADFEYNWKVTKKVVEIAHPLNVSVEGELGCLGSLETGTGDQEDSHGATAKLEKHQLLTDPDQAVEFVKLTNIDALAVAIGTSHGAYKFSRKPTKDILSMTTIEAINSKLPNTHMVMHGSSSVPEHLLGILNEYGAQIPKTYGVPIAEIQKAIKLGVRKINIDTDNRLAMTGAVRKALYQNTKEFDPRFYLKLATKAMQEVVLDRLQAFGCAGHGLSIRKTVKAFSHN